MAEAAAVSLLDRTWDRLSRALKEAAGLALVRVTGEVRPDLPDPDLDIVRRQIDACIEAKGGEVSARARAADLAQTYLRLAPPGKERFLALLATTYGFDIEAAAAAAQAFAAQPDGKALAKLRATLRSPRQKLLAQFSAVPQGVKFLVDLRADVLDLARTRKDLHEVDADLKDLLAGWFDIGFLELRQIGWDAPAALLEKLIAYEAVHEIRSWTDLKNRLDSDRRCYAFFHPRMPDEPLIFVEVALVKGMADNVQVLLDESAPAASTVTADTAIFYSISNCQAGLAGISFGNFLIKRVVEQLQATFPKLNTFATLSPIPGFRAWLDKQDGVLDAGEKAALATGAADLNLPDDLRSRVEALCAQYLMAEKRDGRALDRVAHFHLSNGARLERLNWLGDRSEAGFRQAYGMMVNYRYKLDEIELNHETYATDGTVPAIASVRRLVRG